MSLKVLGFSASLGSVLLSSLIGFSQFFSGHVTATLGQLWRLRMRNSLSFLVLIRFSSLTIAIAALVHRYFSRYSSAFPRLSVADQFIRCQEFCPFFFAGLK